MQCCTVCGRALAEKKKKKTGQRAGQKSTSPGRSHKFGFFLLCVIIRSCCLQSKYTEASVCPSVLSTRIFFTPNIIILLRCKRLCVELIKRLSVPCGLWSVSNAKATTQTELFTIPVLSLLSHSSDKCDWSDLSPCLYLT